MARATIDCLLSASQLDVLQSVAEGFTYIEIAQARGTSTSTIRGHIEGARKKLKVKRLDQAVIAAYREGWILIEPSPEEVILHRVEELFTEIAHHLRTRRGQLSPDARQALESFERALQGRPRKDDMNDALDRVVDTIYKTSLRAGAKKAVQ